MTDWRDHSRPHRLAFLLALCVTLAGLALVIAIAQPCAPGDPSLTVGGMLVAGCPR